MRGQKPREIALRVLHDRQEGGFVEDRLERALGRGPIASPDRRLAQQLVYGVVRWQATLDWLIARKTHGRTQKPLLRSLLQLGLYQIFWLDRIPNHAAVNETVELAKQNRLGTQAGFINAVLRGYLREFDATRHALAALKDSQPHIGFSHPQWLLERWQRRWGAELTAKLMEWNNTPPDTFARVNTLKIDPAKLLPRWREEDVEYDFVRRDWLEENLLFELKAHPPLAQLPSFRAGAFYVQDPSTLLAVRELDPRPGETVLDLCAAPGGKLTYIAQRMGNQGRIIAHDLTLERLKLIEENCSRLGVTCVQTMPPSGLDSLPAGSIDAILIDAPCSNTGVMRRRIDLRWRLQPEEIDRLQKTQLDLVRRATPLLKPGGKLVYSTCSLEAEENEKLIEQVAADGSLGLQSSLTLTPFDNGVDGAYVARLAKVTSP